METPRALDLPTLGPNRDPSLSTPPERRVDENDTPESARPEGETRSPSEYHLPPRDGSYRRVLTLLFGNPPSVTLSPLEKALKPWMGSPFPTKPLPRPSESSWGSTSPWRYVGRLGPHPPRSGSARPGRRGVQNRRFVGTTRTRRDVQCPGRCGVGVGSDTDGWLRRSSGNRLPHREEWEDA